MSDDEQRPLSQTTQNFLGDWNVCSITKAEREGLLACMKERDRTQETLLDCLEQSKCDTGARSAYDIASANVVKYRSELNDRYKGTAASRKQHAAFYQATLEVLKSLNRRDLRTVLGLDIAEDYPPTQEQTEKIAAAFKEHIWLDKPRDNSDSWSTVASNGDDDVKDDDTKTVRGLSDDDNDDDDDTKTVQGLSDDDDDAKTVRGIERTGSGASTRSVSPGQTSVAAGSTMSGETRE